MACSNLRYILSFLLLLTVSKLSFGDELKFNEPKIDANGNVVLTYVLEDLPINADEILKASAKYLENEYKTTKYTDIETIAEKSIVYGKGCMNSFFTDNGLTKSEVFSAVYYLRIDAKDGEARIQLIFNKYDEQQLSDLSDQKVYSVTISEVAPFADAKNNGRYKKAFYHLTENAEIVLKSVVDKLKSVSPAPVMDEW